MQSSDPRHGNLGLSPSLGLDEPGAAPVRDARVHTDRGALRVPND